MAVVKFYSGSDINLANREIEDGAIYFIPNDVNGANIAYDIVGQRHWINRPIIKTLQELVEDSEWVPVPGMIIVVSDSYTEDGIPRPGLKIGDGETTALDLPYIANYTDASVLLQVKMHMEDDTIHHTVTANNYTLQIMPSAPTYSVF